MMGEPKGARFAPFAQLAIPTPLGRIPGKTDPSC
jgi:hypothetical protein